MKKKVTKVVGASLAGAAAIGCLHGPINTVNANESDAVRNAEAKIQHIIYSINKNYAGLKNQAQWEAYIKEARELIAKIPESQKLAAEDLTYKVDGLADTVKAIARINQVEKSMAPKSEGGYGNYLGIKNAAQWREYLDLAKKDMESIDRTVFQAKYEELTQRYNNVENKVKAIEDKHYKDLEEVKKLFNKAKDSASLEDANKALDEAKKLGTHETSTKIIKEIEAFIEELKKDLAIDKVYVKYFDKIAITGEGLAKLKSEDISVEGNKIKSIKLSSDLKELEVLLEKQITTNEVKVTINTGKEKKDYIISNSFKISSIEIKEEVFDNDRVKQNIKLKVNSNDITVEDLTALGYDVKFVATNSKGLAANIFEGDTNTSSEGILKGGSEKGTYKVEIQLIKDGKIIISSEANIKIANLDENAVIREVLIANTKPTWSSTTSNVKYDNANGNSNDEFVGEAYKLNSNTLVAGEEARVYGVFANMNGLENTLVKEENIEVESSSSKIVSVEESSDASSGYAKYKLKAQSPGTAVITVKVGNEEKKINITVTNEKRVLKKLVPETREYNVSPAQNGVINMNVLVNIETTDNHGDPIGVESTIDLFMGNVTQGKVDMRIDKVEVGGSQVDPFWFADVDTNEEGSIGKGIVQFTPNATIDSAKFMGKSTNVYFVNNHQNPNTGITSKEVLSTMKINMLRNNVAAQFKLDILDVPGRSNSSTLDISDPTKDKATIQLTTLNSNGDLLGIPNVYIAGENENTFKEAVIEGFKKSYGINNQQAEVKWKEAWKEISSSKYEIESLQKEIIDISREYGPGLVVHAQEEGKATIVIRNRETKKILVTKEFNVTNSNIQIKSVDFKQLPTVTYKNNIIKLSDVLDVEESNKDYVVKGITLTTNTTAKVRLAKNPVIMPSYPVGTNELYLDVDNNGEFSSGDIRLGYMTAEIIKGKSELEALGSSIKNIYFGEEIIRTPLSPVSGEVIVKVSDKENKSEIGSTTFKIEISN